MATFMRAQSSLIRSLILEVLKLRFRKISIVLNCNLKAISQCFCAVWTRLTSVVIRLELQASLLVALKLFSD